MGGDDAAKADLCDSLQQGRDAILWKLEGLSEYDARRPMTPTATNVLGLVRHLSFAETGWFGPVFGRTIDGPHWSDDDLAADPHLDMWVPAELTRADVVEGYRRVWAQVDDVVAELPLDAPGRVPHRPAERAATTLHRVLVHVATETHRHAGHVDILRESLDGVAGLRRDVDNLPAEDDWARHHARVEAAARRAHERSVSL